MTLNPNAWCTKELSALIHSALYKAVSTDKKKIGRAYLVSYCSELQLSYLVSYYAVHCTKHCLWYGGSACLMDQELYRLHHRGGVRVLLF